MVEKTLVEGQLTDAAELVRRLDSRGDSPSIAVWNYFSDASEWKLMLAGPAFDQLLPKSEAVAYRKIVEVLNKPSPLSSISVGEIKLQKTDNPFLNIVRFITRTPPEALMQGHVTNTTVNGIFVEAMVVLRSS